MQPAMRESSGLGSSVAHFPHPRPPAASPAPALLCTPCRLFGQCAPCAGPAALALVGAGHRLAAGQVLYRQGEARQTLYAVRSGTIKSSIASADGRSQVCAFHMGGEVLGVDAAGGGVHTTTATALEDTRVCAVPHACVAEQPDLLRGLNRLLGMEIARAYRLAMLLGYSSALERLAAFLIDLSQRYQAQGYSPCDFNLRMTRADIGSHLGMTFETVSRTLSHLQQAGQIQVIQRHVQILDLAGFRRRYGALLQA
jgi:CRP/FNR family transcriptional regulator, anaerobic regulatory protein